MKCEEEDKARTTEENEKKEIEDFLAQEQAELKEKIKKFYILEQSHQDLIKNLILRTYDSKEIEYLAEQARSTDFEKRLEGVIGLRKLSSTCQEKVDKLILNNQELRQMFLQFCVQEESPQIKMESIWLLTNFLGGPTEQCAILAPKIVPIFLSILRTEKRKQILEQTLWGLGNISGESPFYRDMLIDQGGLSQVTLLGRYFYEDNFLKNCCWVISNLCRGDPLPHRSKVFSAVRFLIEVIRNEKMQLQSNKQFLADCLWSIEKHLSSLEWIQQAIDQGLPRVLLNYLERSQRSIILVPALSILRIISSGSISQRIALDRNRQVQKAVVKFFDHRKRQIKAKSIEIFINLTLVEGFLENDSEFWPMVNRLMEMSQNQNPKVTESIPLLFHNIAVKNPKIKVYNFYIRCFKTIPQFLSKFYPLNPKKAKNLLEGLTTMMELQKNLGFLHHQALIKQSIRSEHQLIDVIMQNLDDDRQIYEENIQRFTQVWEQEQ